METKTGSHGKDNNNSLNRTMQYGNQRDYALRKTCLHGLNRTMQYGNKEKMQKYRKNK